MSYAMHKQVHPPTGVDHACAAYFTHPIGDGGPPNLIVTQANHLTVFAIRRESSTATDAQLGARAVAQAKQTANADASVGADVEVSLEVVAEFDLQGTVGSLCALRRRFGAPRNQRDALCIAVRENKLSVVEFDPATQSLVNSSLHSWETPTGLGGVPSAHRVAPLPPLAVADPEGRCAAVLLRGEGGSRLALLPAVEGESFGGEELVDVDEELDEADDAGEGVFSHKNNSRGGGDVRARGTAASVKDSYVLDLAREMKISGVRDAAFLHGYGEPTILVLHEKKPTWAGRLALVNDTCVLSAITLDLDNKRHAVIWRRDRLPHSSYRLCAMPEPLGGALVLSQNFIMHESQESSRALALNPLAGGDAGDESARNAARAAAEAAALATTAGNAAAQDPSLANPPAALASREGTESALGVSVELDAAHAAVVSERRVLLTTKAGALMLLSLRVEGRRLARHGAMHLRRAGGAVLSSGMCLLTRRLLFLGSRVGDSLLVSMQEKDVAATQALPAAPSLKGESTVRGPGGGQEAQGWGGGAGAGGGRAVVEARGRRRRRTRGYALRRGRGRRRGRRRRVRRRR
jgi:cleavage and polyadenylation specificity factor subunit 1